MCRRNSAIAIIVGVLMAHTFARGDDVASFLERHGLRQLLAVHLEQQLDTVRGEPREIIMHKLADLYAELLETVEDPEDRHRLEEGGRDLVARLPSQDAGALRLALLRGSYRTAERIAENHRLRLSTEEDLDNARELLTDIIPKFTQLRKLLETNIELKERRLTRAGGLEATRLFNDVEQSRALFDECTFYNAWALYYQSWLHERRDNALVAIRLFSELLDLDSFNPDANEVSIDQRSMEAIARSILGIALCKSMTSSGPTAINWISLLEHENTFAPLREETPVWRIAIWLEHDEFSRARDELGLLIESGREIPSPWLRLMVVHALERGPHDRHAVALVQYAVTQLASREELDQVLDIARRYGAQALGDQGFSLRYVSGVMTYSEARTRHGSELPATESTLIEQYDQAAGELEASLLEHDVESYPEAAAACRRLIGYCLYFQGRFLDARTSFVQAASLLRQTDEAAEALWMAIVCLDKITELRSNDHLNNELQQLMARFLREYPSSAYTPKILLKQAIASEQATDEMIETLLEIPENSEVYMAARRRASHALYQRFRDVPNQQKQSYARRFIDISMPIMTEEMRRINEKDSPSVQELLARCRMLLEVALTEGVYRLAAARQGFNWLEELEASHGAILEPYRDELAYRRLRERLHSGDLDQAASLADALWERDGQSIWSRLSSRALFNHGHHVWRQAETEADADVELSTLQLVDKYGGHILREAARDTDTTEDQAVLRYNATVAEAAKLIWERTGDESRGQAALTLYERLLRMRPANASFLRATASLSEKFEKPRQALDCWRTILAGSDVRSESWFEAKFHQISMLMSLEQSERAREVLTQHIQLNPDYGPDPWGARLMGLERRLTSESILDADEGEGEAP